MEIWKPVVGYENIYQVSNLGNVKNIEKNTLKKPTLNKSKRFCVLLWANNKSRSFKVHRLILFAFIGSPPFGYECCHNDGNPSNNNLSNLRWDTASNNQKDRVKHGTSNRGEQCGTSKLTEKQAISIISDTRKHKDIALEYGVAQTAISRIKSGKRWAHLQNKEYIA